MIHQDSLLLCEEALVAFGCVVLVHHDVKSLVHGDPVLVGLSGLPHVHQQCLPGIHYNPIAEFATYVVPKLLAKHQTASSSSPAAHGVEELGGEDGQDVEEDCLIDMLFQLLSSAVCKVHDLVYT